MQTITVKGYKQEPFTLNNGDRFSVIGPMLVDYRPDSSTGPIKTITIQIEVTFENIDGILTQIGPILVSGHPDFRNVP